MKKKCTRKEVKINRLRANYTKLTHSYLIEGMQHRPVCDWCQNAYYNKIIITIKHLIVACPGLNNERREIIEPRSRGDITMEKLLREGGSTAVVMEYFNRLRVLDPL